MRNPLSMSRLVPSPLSAVRKLTVWPLLLSCFVLGGHLSSARAQERGAHTVAPDLSLPPVERPMPVEGPQAQLVEASALIHAAQGRSSHNVSGAGLVAAVLDTGINATHADFAGKIVISRNYTTNDGGDTTGNNSVVTDRQGHGTNVSSLILANGTHTGIAPGANLAVFKVLSDSGSGQDSWINAALQWLVTNAVANNISVVNMSLGSMSNNTTDPSGDTQRNLIAQLRALKVAVVIAAGNDYGTYQAQGMARPAIFRECVSVGAVYDANVGQISGGNTIAYTTAADRITPFSQRLSPAVGTPECRTDIFAPGSLLTGAGITGNTSSSTMQGTSQAAPIVAGAILLMQQKYKAANGTLPSIDLIEQWLRSSGTTIVDGDDEDDNVVHTNASFKRVDVLASLNAIGSGAPIVSATSTTVAENAGTANVSVSLSQSVASTVTVNYATSSGTATSGLDFTGTSGSLSFAPGETTKTVSIPIIDDQFVEGDESFTLTLSGAVNAALSETPTATITITDNDTLTLVSPASFSTYPSGNYLVRSTTTSTGVTAMNFYRRPMVTASSGGGAIPTDGNTFTTTLTVSNTAVMRSVYFNLDYTHPAYTELNITLTTPGGSQYTLNGGPGTYNLTSILGGQAVNGTYTIAVRDGTLNANNGTFNKATLLSAPLTGNTDTLIATATSATSGNWDSAWNTANTPNGYYSATVRSMAGSTQLGEAVNDLVVVSKTAPSVAVVLSSNAPFTKDTLTATATPANFSATPTYNYDWSVAGTLKQSGTGNTFNLATAGFGDKGQVITCVVTATAPSESATVSASATVANSAPTMKPIVLSTTTGRNFLGRPEFTDADNDSVGIVNVTATSAVGTITGYQLSGSNTDGLYLYTARGTTGVDTFTFAFSDGTVGGTQTATITVDNPISVKYTALGASDVAGYGASDYDLSKTTFSPANGYAPKLAASDKLGGVYPGLGLSRRAINGLTLSGANRAISGQSTLSLAIGDQAKVYTVWYGPNDVLLELLPLLITNVNDAAALNTAKNNYITNWKSGYTTFAGTLTGANPTAKFGAITLPDLGPSLAQFAGTNYGVNAAGQAALASAITDACAQMSSHIIATFPNSVDLQNSTDLAGLAQAQAAPLVFNPATDLFTDGYHPNDSGYAKLAARLFRLVGGLAPVNSVPGAQTVPQDTNLVFNTANGNRISVSDGDIGAGTMTVTLGGRNGRAVINSVPAGVTVGGTPGSLVLSGTLANINTALDGLVFVPSASFKGQANLVISSNDGGNNGTVPLTDRDTIVITVTAVNKVPVANADSASVAANGSVTIPVLSNDTDGDGDTLTVSSVGVPTAPIKGTLVKNNDNTVTYQSTGAVGSDTFSYVVSDGKGGTATGTVTVTITAPVNDLTNVTNSPVSVTGYGLVYNVRSKRYIQQIVLKNNGTTAINTPLFVILDNLSANATLYNKSGNVTTYDASGSPYITLPGPLAPGASIVVSLEFVCTGTANISYNTRVLTGTGTP